MQEPSTGIRTGPTTVADIDLWDKDHAKQIGKLCYTHLGPTELVR